jgi:hypothetical protein
VPVPTSAEAALPANVDKFDEKPGVPSVVEFSAATAMRVSKESGGGLQEIVTVEKTEEHTLMVYWKQ